MTDIAARLRTWTDGNEPTAKEREAADEIERLRAKVKKYEDEQCAACRAYRETEAPRHDR
jgi:hypothetical protein